MNKLLVFLILKVIIFITFNIISLTKKIESSSIFLNMNTFLKNKLNVFIWNYLIDVEFSIDTYNLCFCAYITKNYKQSNSGLV